MAMDRFNYANPGELYYPKPSRLRHHQGVNFRRFNTAAEAIRFAIENIPAPFLSGCYMEVDGLRYDARELQELYEGSEYPLSRLDDKP
jgi:hypothetical protein